MPWVKRVELQQVSVVTRRVCLPIAVALVLGACSDATAPLDRQHASGLPSHDILPGSSEPFSWPSSNWGTPPVPTGIVTLQQSPTAPPLETYQVSFVASRRQSSTVTVNYQAVNGDTVGRPFLRFSIPKWSLVAGAGGVPLMRGDSVTITLTIDPGAFSVDFQPTGVLFSNTTPASLTLWYENANPDLNGDGVVDSTDAALRQQLTFYYQLAGTSTWTKHPSNNDPATPSVTGALYHFSEYAVSW
jgi:hypothetical protein